MNSPLTSTSANGNGLGSRLRSTRRALLAAAGLSVTGCLARSAPTVDTPSADAPGEWTHAGRDAANTGYEPDGRGPSEGNVAWRYTPGYATLVTAPVVVAGTAYVGAANESGGLYAVDLRTGRNRWVAKAETSVAVSPAASDGRLHAAGASGVVFTVDRTGRLLWEVELPFRPAGVAVADGTVYVTARGRRPAEPVLTETGDVRGGRHRSAVVALDAATGERRWRADHPVEFETRPVVGGGTVVAVDREGTILGYNAESGERLWTTDESRRAYTSATVSDETVFVDVYELGSVSPRTRHLLALDTTTGAQRWRTRLPGEGSVTNVVARGTVYAACYGDACDADACGTLVGYDARTGEERWRRDAPIDQHYSSLVGAGDNLYLGTYRRLHAVAVESGEVRWDAPLDASVASDPAVAGGLLVSGRLYALR